MRMNCTACGYPIVNYDRQGRCSECGMSLSLSAKYQGVTLRALRRIPIATALFSFVIGLTVLAVGWDLLASTEVVWAPELLHILVLPLVMGALNATVWLISSIDASGGRGRVVHVVRVSAGIGVVAMIGMVIAGSVATQLLAVTWALSGGIVVVGVFVYIEQVADWLADARVHAYARGLLWAIAAFIATNCVLAFGIAVLGIVTVLYEVQSDVLWLVGISAWLASATGFAAYCSVALAVISKGLWRVVKQLDDDILARRGDTTSQL